MTILSAVKMQAEKQGSSLSILTQQQQENFSKNGFLVLQDFIQPHVCQHLIERANFLIDQFDPEIVKTVFSTTDQKHAKHQYFLDSGDKIHFFFEEKALDENGNLKVEKSKAINKFGHAIHDLDPVFYCFSRMHKIAMLFHDLGLIDPLIVQSMYICKQPHIGGEVNCHQDGAYLYAEKQPVIGLWFALEDATIENGCLWAIPGGHKTPLKSRFIRDANNKTRNEIYDHSPWPLENRIPLEVKQGSVIVLHGLSPHMSKENMSSRSRHAFTLHAISSGSDYAADNWLQRSTKNPFSRILD
jgi:phytanoyl-CoA hydroxylase